MLQQQTVHIDLGDLIYENKAITTTIKVTIFHTAARKQFAIYSFYINNALDVAFVCINKFKVPQYFSQRNR